MRKIVDVQLQEDEVCVFASDTIAKIAHLCHDVNRAYCAALGDASQPTWADAPDWQKESAIDGVYFHIGSNKTTTMDSHNNWLAKKIADGWKYGPVKDAIKKEHPCCVPYEQLPAEQKAKDYIFKAICDYFREAR